MVAFQNPIWRKIGFTIGVVLLVLLGFAQLLKKDLFRLHFVLTLFQPSAIVENFRSMTRVWDYTTVRRSGPTYRLPYNNKPLPESYVYMGSAHDLTGWIAATATSGLIVVHDGAIAFERYYRGNDARTHWVAWSASHPVITALAGCALEEGLLRSTTDLVNDYVPLLNISGYAGVTLQDALQMSSGIVFDENYARLASDINRVWRSIAWGTVMDDIVVATRRIRPPGKAHGMVSMDAQVLAMVLREATGRSLSTYMEEKLWSRLGVEADAFWLVDDSGMEMAFGGLNASLRDYARFGLLFLNAGRNFRGQQILPAHWVRASVAPDHPHPKPRSANTTSRPSQRYGYQWWLPDPPEGDYYAMGIGGQFIYIHPRHRVVIVKTSADADDLQIGTEMASESLAVFRAIAAHLAGEP